MVMKEHQKGCKKNNPRADEEKQLTVARMKQQKEEGKKYRHKAGGEGKQGIKERNKALKMKNRAIKTTRVITAAFALAPLNPTKTNKAKHYRLL